MSDESQSMTTDYDVTVRNAHGVLSVYKLHVLSKTPWTLQLEDSRSEKFTTTGFDAFDALKKLRVLLEESGSTILCNGSRIEAFPSPMSRSMGGGVLAYIHKFGEPASRSSLVNIFESATLDQLGTVAQQDDFHKKWKGYFKDQWKKS